MDLDFAPTGVTSAARPEVGAPVARADRATTRPALFWLQNIDRALVVGDFAVFAACGAVAWVVTGQPGGDAAVAFAAIAATAFAFSRVATAGRVYRTPSHRLTAGLVRRLLQALVVTLLGLFAVTILLRQEAMVTRELLGAWATFATCGLLVFRSGLVTAVGAAMARGHLQRRVAVYGGDGQGQEVLKQLAASDDGHYVIVGFYDDRGDRVPGAIEGFERRGGLPELESALERGAVDEVIVALPLSAVERLTSITHRLSRYSCSVLLAPDLSIWRFLHRPVDVMAGAPMLRVIEVPIQGWAGLVKAVEDRVLAALLLVASAPLLALVALAIRLESPGPILFRQARRGWNGGIFTIYKFRTMREDAADLEGAQQVRRDDPRVTRVGRFLRRTSLDELPQLLNVLNGDMSLVGPRPHALGTMAEGTPFEEAVADYMRRYRVKPGMTGWAQVNGWRGETDTQRKLMLRVRYDIEYIENWTVWFDLYILLITPLALLFGSRNAY